MKILWLVLYTIVLITITALISIFKSTFFYKTWFYVKTHWKRFIFILTSLCLSYLFISNSFYWISYIFRGFVVVSFYFGVWLFKDIYKDLAVIDKKIKNMKKT